jgi:tetratricopeptide (TPR) repeat protein
MAIDFYTQAIELDKQSYQSFSNRGILHVILGNYKLAKDDFTRAIEIKPESPEAIFNFAKFYDQIHQVSLALEYYEKFLKVSEPSMIELLDFANERIIALRALDPTKIPVLPIGVVSKGAKYGMADVSMTFDIESLVNSSTAKQK